MLSSFLSLQRFLFFVYVGLFVMCGWSFTLIVDSLYGLTFFDSTSLVCIVIKEKHYILISACSYNYLENRDKMDTFSPKLDKISENIIYLLSIDSRQSVSNLAKELKLNRKIVENRVQRLFEKGYVRYLAVTNESNRFRFTVLVKLSRIDETVIQKVGTLKGLLKLKETLGQYDLVLLFDVYSQQEVNETISKVSNLLHRNIVTFDVLMHDFEDTLGYKSFCNDVNFTRQYKMLSPASVILTESEKLVADALKKSPNVSYTTLARQTNMNYVKLKGIIDRLQEQEILRFSIDPDYQKLELEFHNILMKIKLGKKKVFENYIAAQPRIHWVKHSKGRWDYVLSVTARSINEFIEITKQIRTDNNSLILDETTLISKVKEVRKY